jgi:hypothetical protein
MNLVLDTLKSRRSFVWLGQGLGVIAATGLYTIWGGFPLRETGIGIGLLAVLEIAAALLDRPAKRMKALASQAFPFKNLPVNDREFLQDYLMWLPRRAAWRAVLIWVLVCPIMVAIDFRGGRSMASWGLGGMVFGAPVSAFCQYFGNSVMGRRVAPFYYFEDSAPEALSRVLPSLSRRFWLWILAPYLLVAGAIILFTGKKMVPVELWVTAWMVGLIFAELKVFQDLVISPIEDLGSALVRFGNGDFSALLDVTSGDVLGETTDRYNKAVRKTDMRFFMLERFGHMVPHDKAEALLEGRIKLDGEEREIGVVACRLSGETMTLPAFNKFCQCVAEIVDRHGGCIDEISQGLIVALFNAPLMIENAENVSLDAAKEIKERLEVFRAQQRMQAGLQLEFGVGLSYGTAVLGLAGPKGRQRYTAFGKPADEARRLCSL